MRANDDAPLTSPDKTASQLLQNHLSYKDRYRARLFCVWLLHSFHDQPRELPGFSFHSPPWLKRPGESPATPWVRLFVEISSRSSRSAKLGWSSLLHNLPEKRGPSGEPIWRTRAKAESFFSPLLSYPDWLPAYIRPPQSLACILKRDGPGQRPWPFGVGPGQSTTWPTNACSPTSCSCLRFSVNSHMSHPMTLWGPVSFQRTAGLHICRGGSYPQRDVGMLCQKEK